MNSSGSILQCPLVIASGAMLVCAALSFIGFIFTRQPYSGKLTRTISTLLELGILLFLTPVLLGWSLLMPASLGGLVGMSCSQMTYHFLLGSAVKVLPIFLMLIVIRFIPNRLLVLVTCAIIAVVAWLWIDHASAGILKTIRSDDTEGFLKNHMLVSTNVLYWRTWTWIIFSFLGGLYAIRNRFSVLRFVIGCIIVGSIFHFLQMPYFKTNRPWIPTAAFALFGLIVICLPGFRSALEKLTGSALDSEKAKSHSSLPYSPVAATFGYCLIAYMACTTAYSAAINWFELKQANIMYKGIAPVWHSPALVNGYGALKALCEPTSTTAKLPKDIIASTEYYKLESAINESTSATRDQIWRKTDLPAFKRIVQQMKPYTMLMEKAGNADYLEIPKWGFHYQLNLEIVANLTVLQSQLATREGRTSEALEDVDKLLKLAGLFVHDTNLIGQVMGLAVRHLGTGAAWSLIQTSPDNKETMNALSAVLEQSAGKARKPLQFQDLERGEPGYMRILIPNFEMMVPDLQRAWMNSLAAWIDFDLVSIGTALERYRNQNGQYPERLELLTPGFLKRVPLDPLTGSKYDYRLGDSSGKAYRLTFSKIPKNGPTFEVYKMGEAGSTR